MSTNSTKIMDIVQPRDDWERGFAKLEYERTGLKQALSKKILVTDDMWINRHPSSCMCGRCYDWSDYYRELHD